MGITFFMALSLPAKGISFANSLGTDQAQQKVGPDLDLNYLTLMVFMKEFLKNRISRPQKSMQNYRACNELN